MVSLFLVTHGSRNPASWTFLQHLVATARSLHDSLPIGGGCLEGHPQALEEQIQIFCHGLSPHQSVLIAPIFLLSGVHTHQDIPAAVAIAQSNVAQTLHILPPLGHWPETKALIQSLIPPSPTLLLTHGSSRPQAQEEFRHLCDTLHCLPASWRMEPWLSDQLRRYPQAAVLPYAIRPLPAEIATQVLSLGGTLLPHPLPPKTMADLVIQQYSRSIKLSHPVD